MKENNVFRKILLSLLLGLGLVASTNKLYAQISDMEKAGVFVATPNIVYVLERYTGVISEYNVTTGNLVQVTADATAAQAGDPVNGYLEAKAYIEGKYGGVKPFNCLALSQDGKYAYGVLTSGGYMSKGNPTSLVAILRYDVSKKKWEVYSEVDQWNDCMPNMDDHFMAMGGYDPVNHMFILANFSRVRSNQKLTLRLWGYSVKENKIVNLGYLEPGVDDEVGYSPNANGWVIVNGDLSVYSNGTMRLSINVVGGKVSHQKAFLLKVSQQEIKEAIAANSDSRKMESKVLFGSAEMNLQFSGTAIDTDGHIYVTTNNKIFQLKPGLPLNEIYTVPGNNPAWSDAATVPGRAVMVHYVDEDGKYIAQDEFAMVNVLNGTPYDTRERIDIKECENEYNPETCTWRRQVNLKPEYIFFDHKFYKIVPNRLGRKIDGTASDAEKGVLVDRNFEVTYVYKPLVSEGTPKTSKDIKGAVQTGKPTFINGDKTPIEITGGSVYKFVERNGQEIDATEIPAMDGAETVGTYTIDPKTGDITFTPKAGYTGTPEPAKKRLINKRANLVKGDGSEVAENAEGKIITDALSNGQKVGTYELDPNTGVVTFTPNPDFVGTPDPITVQVYDKLGNKIPASYTPTVLPSPEGVDKTSTGVQGQTQTAKPDFVSQDIINAPIDETKPAVLLNPDGSVATGPVDAMKDGKKVGEYTIAEDGTVTFTPNSDFIGTPDPVTVQRETVEVCDGQGGEHPHRAKATATYTPTVTSVVPHGEPEETTGPQGEEQSGRLEFKAGDDSIPMKPETLAFETNEDGTPKEQPTGATLSDDGKTLTVPNEGAYKIEDDGSVTFTPEKDFVGKAQPVTLVMEDKNGTKAKASYTPTVTAVTPTGEPATSKDVQGKDQTGTPTFKNGDDTQSPLTPSEGNPAKLVKPDGTLVESMDAMKDGEKVGEYTIDPITGEVTFSPEKDFVGTPDPAKVQVKDANGTPAEALYTPTVTAVTPTAASVETTGPQGKDQSGKPVFTAGDENVPMDDTTPAKLKDPVTGNEVDSVTVDGEGTYTVAADGTVTFTPEKDFVGRAKGVTVVRQDTNGTKAEATYTPTVTAVTPTGTPAKSTGVQGAEQTGTPTFTPGDENVPMDDTTPAKLKDPKTGAEVTSITIPGEGTYTVADDGTVTFQPEPTFTGKGTPVTVIRQDKNGTKVEATYTPTVTAVTPTGEPAESTGKQGEEQTGTPTFKNGDDTQSPLTPSEGNPAKLLDKDGNEVVGNTTPALDHDGKEIGTYTIDPNTGVVTFTPNPDFVGRPEPVQVQVKDANGTPAVAEYQPHVTPNRTTKWVTEGSNPKDLKDPVVAAAFEEGEKEITDKDGNVWYLTNPDVEPVDGVKTYVYSKQKETVWQSDDDNPKKLKPVFKGKDFSEDNPETIDVIEEVNGKKEVVTYYKKETLPDTDSKRTYVYTKEKTTRWVDSQGNELKAPEKGKDFKAQDAFEGYRYKESKLSDNDNTKTYIFVKSIPWTPLEPVYTTKWVTDDKEPITLKDPVSGKAYSEGEDVIKKMETVDGKDVVVKYYKDDTKTTEKNGVKTYVYSKEKTTRWVDENGNPLKPDVKGKDFDTDNPETLVVDGVTYNKKETVDSDGVKTYVYERAKVTKFIYKDKDGNKVEEIQDSITHKLGEDYVSDTAAPATIEKDGDKYFKVEKNVSSTDEASKTKEIYYTKASIELKKSGEYLDANKDGVLNIGDKIKYTFVVTNTGGITVNDIKITDAKLNVTDQAIDPATLGVGESGNFVKEYSLTAEDIAEGKVENTATAAGNVNGEPITDDSDSTNPDDDEKNPKAPAKSSKDPNVKGKASDGKDDNDPTVTSLPINKKTRWVTDDPNNPTDLKDPVIAKDFKDGDKTLKVIEGDKVVTYYLDPTKTTEVDGVKTYVYSKEKTTSFVDENGKKIIPSEVDKDYKDGKEKITDCSGNVWVLDPTKTTINDKGEKVYVYTREKTTRWVQKGNLEELKPSEKGIAYQAGPERISKGNDVFVLVSDDTKISGTTKTYYYILQKQTKWVSKKANERDKDIANVRTRSKKLNTLTEEKVKSRDSKKN